MSLDRGAVELAGLAVLLFGVVVVALLSRARRRRDSSPPPVEPDGGYPTRSVPELSIGSVRSLVVRALTTTNHREIGMLYIVFGTVAALWGGVDAMMLRTELLTPAADIWTPETYNAIFTMHGVTMLFFFVTPVFFGLGNYFIPLLVDADDMAFPRLNAIGFWVLPPALVVARSGILAQMTGQFLGLLMEVPIIFETLREPGVGWTLYTPLSTATANPQIDFLLLGLHLSGIGTTIGAINFIVTIAYERGEGVNWATLDIFSWNMLVTSALVLFAFPLLGSAVVMLLLDRNFGTAFYAVEGGGPILWQHLFWFFGHPEVYIIFLPATGLMSTILPKFSARKLFGFRFIVYSTIGIGVLSFGVWAHHMFVTGVDPRVKASFMAVSIAIAVPSAIKVFNWLTTMWDGNIRLNAPMLLCVGALGTFVIGGVTGVFLAAIPVDVLYHGTYYVVGHFHLILMGIIPFMMFAASYYWYPLLTGRWYDRRLAMFQSALLVVGTLLTFGTLVVLGLLELPRRLAIYPPEFTSLQQVATVGAYVIGLSVLLWLYNLVASYWIGDPVRTTDPWELKKTDQFTREWQWFEDRLVDRYGFEATEPATVRPSATDVPEEGSPTVSRALSSVSRNLGETVALGAASGLVGTLLLSSVLFPAVVIGVFDLSAFGELAELVGLQSQAVGYALFLVGGVTTWPLLFASLAEYLPGRRLFVAGITYSTVMATGFLVAFYTGQSGLELLGYLGFSLVGHWLYGLGMAVTFQYLTTERRRRRSLDR